MWWLPALLLNAAPLSFDSAVALADQTPAIVGLEGAAKEQRDARLSPLPNNPQLSVQPGFRTLPGQPAGPEGFFSVSQTFNLGGLSKARRAVASGEADSSTANAAVQRTELRVAIARAWLDAWVAHSAMTVLSDERAEAEKVVALLTRASTAGAVTRVEAATMRAFSGELRAQLLDWTERELEARLRLASLLSLHEPPELADRPPELSRPELTPPRPERLPHVRLLDTERRLETLREQEVAAQWAPQLQTSLQFGHEWQGQWVGYAGFSLTLPIFERGQRERAAHRAAVLRLDGLLTQARADVHVAWKRLEHELEHTEEVLHAVKDEQLPAALEAAELERRRSLAGETTIVELVFLRRQAVAARIATALAESNVLAARHRAHEFLRLNEDNP